MCEPRAFITLLRMVQRLEFLDCAFQELRQLPEEDIAECALLSEKLRLVLH